MLKPYLGGVGVLGVSGSESQLRNHLGRISDYLLGRKNNELFSPLKTEHWSGTRQNQFLSSSRRNFNRRVQQDLLCVWRKGQRQLTCLNNAKAAGEALGGEPDVADAGDPMFLACKNCHTHIQANQLA